MITEQQKNCRYCHQQLNTRGQFIRDARVHTTTEWYGYYNQTLRRKVSTEIVSPENKHPRLRSAVMFHTGPANQFDIPIDSCPWCGRELHQEN